MECWVQVLGFGVQGLGAGLWGFGSGVQSLGFRVQGSGYRVEGIGFGVWSLQVKTANARPPCSSVSHEYARGAYLKPMCF